MNEQRKDQDPKQGIQESRQDRKQDDVAKQRPGQRDQQVRDAHSRGPQRKMETRTGLSRRLKEKPADRDDLRVFYSGGAKEDRTPDLVIANDALSQLSYGPTAGLQCSQLAAPCQADPGCAGDVA